MKIITDIDATRRETMKTIHGQTPDPDCEKCTAMAQQGFPTPVCPEHWAKAPSRPVPTSTCSECGETGNGIYAGRDRQDAEGTERTARDKRALGGRGRTWAPAPVRSRPVHFSPPGAPAPCGQKHPEKGEHRMLKPQVTARTGLHKHTLTVSLDFDFRIGKVRYVEAGTGRRAEFLVYLGTEAVGECFRYSPNDPWEFRWHDTATAAPLWLRASVPHGALRSLPAHKHDAARQITRAFEHGLRFRFQGFNPDTGSVL